MTLFLKSPQQKVFLLTNLFNSGKLTKDNPKQKHNTIGLQGARIGLYM